MDIADLLALPLLEIADRAHRACFRPRLADVKAEKEIVNRLVVVLATSAVPRGGGLCLGVPSVATLSRTRSPWRLACCQEYLDATTAAFLVEGAFNNQLPASCAAIVANFLWQRPKAGQYLAAWQAQEGPRLTLCQDSCGGLRCKNSCQYFHPPPEILQLAQAGHGDARDHWITVQEIYRERELVQGIPSPVDVSLTRLLPRAPRLLPRAPPPLPVEISLPCLLPEERPNIVIPRPGQRFRKTNAGRLVARWPIHSRRTLSLHRGHG